MTADDVAVVVLHLNTPPPPAHAGRPAGIPPAATTAAAANDPGYLAASRAAAAAPAPPPRAAAAAVTTVPFAATQPAASAVAAVPAASERERLRAQSGVLPVTAVQDPAERSLKVVTARPASGGSAQSSTLPAPSGLAPAAVTDFRTDSAYAQDLRCDSLIGDTAYRGSQLREHVLERRWI